MCTELPACDEGLYRPTPNAECEAIPECDPGYERLTEGTPDETGIIPCTLTCEVGYYRPTSDDECEEFPDCEEGFYRSDIEVLECEAIPECPDGGYRSPIGEVDPSTGLIPCESCPEGESYNEEAFMCESNCREDETWSTELQECELPNECLMETWWYDESDTVDGDEENQYKCSAENDHCDCDGLRECVDGWCRGTPGANREGTRYPYDETSGFAYDPENDDDYFDHYIDQDSGYPTMIDPATGKVWGINPETDEPFDGVVWPTDDDEPLDPMWEEDKS